MFFNENIDEYNIIENISIFQLEEWVKTEGIKINEYSTEFKWALFAYYKARTIDISKFADTREISKTKGKGLNIIRSSSFANNIAKYMTNKDVFFSIEGYMKENKIKKEIENIYSKIDKTTPITTQKKKFFNDVLFFYSIDGERFEKRIFKHDCYIPKEEYDTLTYLKKSNNIALGKQIGKLSKKYNKCQEYESIKNKSNRITFYLTYTEENEFIKIPGKHASDKIVNLIHDYVTRNKID